MREAAVLAETEAEKEELRKRLAAIDQSRESVQQAIHADALAQEKRGLFGRRRRRGRRESKESDVVVEMSIGEFSNETARLIKSESPRSRKRKWNEKWKRREGTIESKKSTV